MYKIPKCKSKIIIPQHQIKIDKKLLVEEKTHNIYQRKLKFSNSNHSFGKEITNVITNKPSCGMISSIAKRSPSIKEKVRKIFFNYN